MRVSPVLLCCLALAHPATARDLALSVAWDIAADAQVVAVLRRADGAVLSSARVDVALSATTAEFSLVDIPRQAASVQAALIGTSTIWAQSPVLPIDPRGDALAMTLSRHLGPALTAQFACGEALGTATLRLQSGVLRLTNSPEPFALRTDAPRVWSSESGLQLEPVGTRLMGVDAQGAALECLGLPAEPLLPLVAQAGDDMWRIELRADGAEFRLGPTDATLAMRDTGLPIKRTDEGALLVSDPDFDLFLDDRICSRAGDRVPYPLTARLERVQLEGPVVGCAGAPVALLTGPEWKVTSLLGRSLGAEMTLSFSETELAGRSSCNRYLAALEIDQGQMDLRDLGTTRLGCDIAARNLEQRFLNALEGVSGFEIGRDGTLILRAGVTAVLTARRK